ncbi:ribonuclease H-like domain-containing protein [Tanacetum coccineum]
MAIPEDHLAKFHKMTDAKEMWKNAIKSRFGGNDKSKKMQKYILKQQFEGFTISNTDGIHKGYETRIPKSSQQLVIHGAGVYEDANQKFLRYYLLLCLQVSFIRGTNQEWTAFVSENTSSTNDVSTAYGVSNTSGHNSKHEQTSSYSLLAMAIDSMRMKKFYKKTGRKLQFDAKEPVGFDKTKVECYNCHKTGHFARECRTKEDNRRRDGWNPGNKDGSRTGKKEESKALVTVDGESVPSCSNECKESYANLKRLYDAQREQLSDASVEIKAYTQGLKKVEAQLVAHQQGQLFSWTFFLRTKDETSAILKDFIRQIENQLNQKVKTIRCDNGTEFKNRDVIEFCGLKGIKREYSNARTPQQNGVAERKNRTLIEAARTMLAESFFT